MHHITDTRSDEFQQYIYAPFSGGIDFDGCLPNSFDTFPYKIYVNFRRIPVAEIKRACQEQVETLLFQLAQQRIHIIFGSQPHHYVKLLDLDIERIIVFTEEHSHLI